MVLVIAVHEILQDGAALKDANDGTVGPLVRDGGDAAVGVDFEEPRLFLLVGAYFNMVDLQQRRESKLLVFVFLKQQTYKLSTRCTRIYI